MAPLTIFLWVMVGVTFVYGVAQLLGYNVLTIILMLLVVDVITLEINRQLDKRKLYNNKLETMDLKLEEVSNKIQNEFNVDEKLNKHKDEVTIVLDKMARKALEIEERVNRFGETIAVSIENLNNRLRAFENPENELEQMEHESEETKSETEEKQAEEAYM